MGISDEMLEAMKAQAKSSGGGGTYVILDEPGEFAAGTVVGIEKEQTSFGEVEECVRVRFTPDTEAKIRKWLKKRKANPNAYILKEG